MTLPKKKHAADQKGFALVVVIVVLLLTTFLASQLILQVRTELKVAYNTKTRAAGLFLAEAGINLGIFRKWDTSLEYDEEFEKFYEGMTYKTPLADGVIRYYVVNESGKIDLYLIRRQTEILRIFLEYHEVEPDQIDIIIDSYQDWIDSDNLHRINGAEKDYYEELEPPYIPRNGKIVDPAEFFLIKGTEGLSEKFAAEEVFTVHSKKKDINFNSLTPAMLDFLVEGDEEKIALYYETLELFVGKLSQIHAIDILGIERFSLLGRYLRYESERNEKFFSIVAIGEQGGNDIQEEMEEAEEETKEQRPATKISVLIKNINKTTFKYLSWQEKNI